MGAVHLRASPHPLLLGLCPKTRKEFFPRPPVPTTNSIMVVFFSIDKSNHYVIVNKRKAPRDKRLAPQFGIRLLGHFAHPDVRNTAGWAIFYYSSSFSVYGEGA